MSVRFNSPQMILLLGQDFKPLIYEGLILKMLPNATHLASYINMLDFFCSSLKKFLNKIRAPFYR
jgi:hypothetical protein